MTGVQTCALPILISFVNAVDNDTYEVISSDTTQIGRAVSKDTVRIWMKEGKLPVYRAGKRYKFKLSEVDAWVREGKIQS